MNSPFYYNGFAAVASLGLLSVPALGETISPTRELMGRAQVEAQSRAGVEMLRRAESSNRQLEGYDAKAAAAPSATNSSIEGIATRGSGRAKANVALPPK